MKIMELDVSRGETTVWIKDDERKECRIRHFYIYQGGRFPSLLEFMEYLKGLVELHNINLIRVLDSCGIGAVAYDMLARWQPEGIIIERYTTWSM